MSSTMASSWAWLSLSCHRAWSRRDRQAADPGVPHSLVAASAGGQVTPGQRGKSALRQGLAGGPAAGIIAGQQQGTQPAGLARCGPP